MTDTPSKQFSAVPPFTPDEDRDYRSLTQHMEGIAAKKRPIDAGRYLPFPCGCLQPQPSHPRHEYDRRVFKTLSLSLGRYEEWHDEGRCRLPPPTSDRPPYTPIQSRAGKPFTKAEARSFEMLTQHLEKLLYEWDTPYNRKFKPRCKRLSCPGGHKTLRATHEKAAEFAEELGRRGYDVARYEEWHRQGHCTPHAQAIPVTRMAALVAPYKAHFTDWLAQPELAAELEALAPKSYVVAFLKAAQKHLQEGRLQPAESYAALRRQKQSVTLSLPRADSVLKELASQWRKAKPTQGPGTKQS